MGGRGAASKLSGAITPPVQNNNLPISLENFDKTQQDYEQKYFSGLTAAEKAEITKDFQYVFAHNSFYMNIKAQYLENVYNEHFKNQQETGTSGGALFGAGTDSTNPRVSRSMEMFGLDPAKMKAADFEKYGSLQSQDILKAISDAPMGYGDALVRFKRSAVFDRTTYTLDDSLGMSTVAGLVSKGQFTGTDKSAATRYSAQDFYSRVKHARTRINDSPNEWAGLIEGSWGSSYLEIQYHGMLTMADVESITFTYNLPSKSFLTKLNQAGIKTYGVDSSGKLYDLITGAKGEDKSRKGLI